MTKQHGSGALDRRRFMARVALGGAALTAALPARVLLAAGKAPDKINVAFFGRPGESGRGLEDVFAGSGAQLDEVSA